MAIGDIFDSGAEERDLERESQESAEDIIGGGGGLIDYDGDGTVSERERARSHFEGLAQGRLGAGESESEGAYGRLLGESAEGGAYADWQDVRAQQNARGVLEQMAEGRLSRWEEARRAEMQRQADQVTRGQRGALAQQLEMTGQSDPALMALMAGQQDAGAGQERQLGMQAMARERALAAMSDYGRAASEERRQGVQERGARASAIDRFNQANTDYLRGVEQRDVARANARQEQAADIYTGNATSAERSEQYNRSRSGGYGDPIVTGIAGATDRDDDSDRWGSGY